MRVVRINHARLPGRAAWRASMAFCLLILTGLAAAPVRADGVGDREVLAWSRYPDGAPPRAKSTLTTAGTANFGVTVLDCSRTEEGAIADCKVLSETPEGLGLGQRALDLVPLFRQSPCLPGRACPKGPTIKVPIYWRKATYPGIAQSASAVSPQETKVQVTSFFVMLGVAVIGVLGCHVIQPAALGWRAIAKGRTMRGNQHRPIDRRSIGYLGLTTSPPVRLRPHETGLEISLTGLNAWLQPRIFVPWSQLRRFAGSAPSNWRRAKFGEEGYVVQFVEGLWWMAARANQVPLAAAGSVTQASVTGSKKCDVLIAMLPYIAFPIGGLGLATCFLISPALRIPTGLIFRSLTPWVVGPLIVSSARFAQEISRASVRWDP